MVFIIIPELRSDEYRCVTLESNVYRNYTVAGIRDELPARWACNTSDLCHNTSESNQF